ncbi:MAG: hypothetical protein JW797_10705 [Bradymonadales bacterium]|nr:hypothetical protein [Bradymonadales bacterium]
MSANPPAEIILLWHFHQPFYGLPGSHDLELPWVRLHAAKSYLDMAAMLLENPKIRAVANFSGSLLEQLLHYRQPGFRDRFWELTLRPAGDLTEEERRFILRSFFSLDWQTVLARFPRYLELLDKRGRRDDQVASARLTDAEMTDLQLLFNLAWCGFTLRQHDQRVRELSSKGRGFNQADKEVILAVQLEAIDQVFGLWRELVDREQVELTVTPHYHPILPLLVDNQIARRSLPGHPLPSRFAYPMDAHSQVAMALDQAEAVFGRRPVGMWPSEGSVSPEILPLVAEHGIRWLASDEHVLLQSKLDGPADRAEIYQPFWSGSPPISLFFRDHELSDLIGFSYSRIEAQQAVRDFTNRLGSIASGRFAAGPPCVTVILDGENAWEHYPQDGRQFLERLYQQLAAMRGLKTTTPTDRLSRRPPARQIVSLHSGSWISANFRIWIGQREKNLAWEQLRRARKLFADRSGGGRETDRSPPEREAYRYLLRAEGSDWMWWYGDDFVAVDKPLFDRIFRENLAAVYHRLGTSPPEELAEPIVTRAAAELVKPPRSLIRPTIDGHEYGYYDWVGAGSCCATGAAGAMYQSSSYLAELRYGFDLERFYLRLRVGERRQPDAGERLSIELDLHQEAEGLRRLLVIPFEGTGRMACRLFQGEEGDQAPLSCDLAEAFFHECLECALPLDQLGLQAGSRWTMSLRLVQNGVELDRLPRSGELAFEVPDETFSERNWIV